MDHPSGACLSNSSRERRRCFYLGEEREHLIQFAKEKIKEEPDINYFVFGHRHVLLDLPIAEHSKVIMLGD